MPDIRVEKISLSLPFGIGGVTVEIGEAERIAAWNLYVELATRISTQELDDDHGLMSSALDSLYSMFKTTRSVLREGGPAVAQGEQSFGAIAVTMLNSGLRPFTGYWHPLMEDYKARKPDDVTLYEWEQQWERREAFRDGLRELQQGLAQYVESLGKMAGVINLHDSERVE